MSSSCRSRVDTERFGAALNSASTQLPVRYRKHIRGCLSADMPDTVAGPCAFWFLPQLTSTARLRNNMTLLLQALPCSNNCATAVLIQNTSNSFTAQHSLLTLAQLYVHSSCCLYPRIAVFCRHAARFSPCASLKFAAADEFVEQLCCYCRGFAQVQEQHTTHE